jgi:hypothetical protein
MKYFIFDMDETLAELYSVYYFIATLRLRETCSDDMNICKNLSESLLKGLDNGYNRFVDRVLSEEVSNSKLGILRPGILDVMKRLSEMQKQGKIKNVVIYSNNGHLESLEFIRDLIHKYIKNDELVRECIHWNHPMRGEEVLGQPGAANKTWNVLRNILIKGNCKASNNIEASDIYFFDDLDHSDLMSNLGGNYYKVPGYNFKASFDRLANIFRDSIRDLGVMDMEVLKRVVMDVFGDRNSDFLEGSIEDVMINLFRGKTKGTVGVNVMPPGQDSGITMMNDAIEKVLTQTGGKKRKIRYGTRKSRVKRMRMKSRVRKN